MEAMAQQKACQGKDVCLSNTTGGPSTPPMGSDSTTPYQYSSQTSCSSWQAALISNNKRGVFSKGLKSYILLKLPSNKAFRVRDIYLHTFRFKQDWTL